MTDIRTVIVGTAGHIDHGKSTLVRALTGVDPDRLGEERERGMTIDLGFAPYRHRSGATVGIIDVPGHERFIKNMVAGATSVEVAMLVVAADDGVMPQTIEHLEILRLLGVSRGLVAVNKIDLVEDELRELALQDVGELVAGTFLEDAPLVAVSGHTGEGVDALRAALDELVDGVPARADEGPFRLPVQRVFSAKGHGLVVTGVPVSGSVAPGDSLEIVDSGRPVRVRGIQAYGAAREAGRSGHSTALNLAGATTEDVRRGHVVATPGVFGGTRFLAVEYTHVDEGLPLRHFHPVRVHVGTGEVMGRAALLDTEALTGRTEGRLQLRLEEQIVTAPGDRLIVRDAASLRLLGGGVVLRISSGRLKRFKERVLGDLEARAEALGDPRALALAALRAAGRRGLARGDLVLETGVAEATVKEVLADAEGRGEVVAAGDRVLTSEAVAALGDEFVAVLKSEHKASPLHEWLDVARLRARFDGPEAVLRAVLERDGRIETAAGGRVRRRGHRVNLSGAQRDARARVLELLREAGPTPPEIGPDATGLPQKETAALLGMMRASGEIAAVGGHLFHAEALEAMRTTIRSHGGARDGEIHIPTLRDELGTTRKYLIPLLEHFDAEGLTARHGERRVLRGPRA